MRAQFNTRIAQATKGKVDKDRKYAGTNDIIAEVALENWFSQFSVDERAKFYRAHWANSRKPFVRTSK